VRPSADVAAAIRALLYLHTRPPKKYASKQNVRLAQVLEIILCSFLIIRYLFLIIYGAYSLRNR
jgi:hypothetical protein